MNAFEYIVFSQTLVKKPDELIKNRHIEENLTVYEPILKLPFSTFRMKTSQKRPTNLGCVFIIVFRMCILI